MNSLAEFLYLAYNSPFGIVVHSDDPDFLRQKLYPIRKDNPDLHCLAFILSPINPGDLWIVKQPEGTDDE